MSDTTQRPNHVATIEHPSVMAQRALTDIATTFPDLIYGLGRNGNSSMTERVTGSRETPLPISLGVSEALGEIHDFARYLSSRVRWEAGDGDVSSMPDDQVMVEVSRRFIGVFCPDQDRPSRDFAKECRQIARRAHSAAYPSGVRVIDVPNRAHEDARRNEPMPCAEEGCGGHYQVKVNPDGKWFTNVADPLTWPPLTCEKDSRHIVTGVELSRAMAYARSTGRTFWDELVRDRAA